MSVDPNIRLAIYNDALILSGERVLFSLEENGNPAACSMSSGRAR